MRRSSVFVAFMSLLLSGFAGAQDHAVAAPVVEIDRAGLPVAVTDVEGVEQHLCRDGRVYIGGQPSEKALERFKELGVTVVVNLRTPKETGDRAVVPFDEAATVAKLGLDYVNIPLGGKDHPYTPDAVERFARVLEAHRGPVFLHCTIGWRASTMWMAYLVRFGGLDLDAALARGRAIAIGPEPLGELLGRPLTLTWAPPAPEPVTPSPR